MEKYHTPKEVAELFGVSLQTVQKWMKGIGVKRPLSCTRIGYLIMIMESDLDAFLEGHKSAPPPNLPTAKERRSAKKLRELQTEERDA